jgi:hypothetical protein
MARRHGTTTQERLLMLTLNGIESPESFCPGSSRAERVRTRLPQTIQLSPRTHVWRAAGLPQAAPVAENSCCTQMALTMIPADRRT